MTPTPAHVQVSVVIPAFEAGSLLTEALDSVAAQAGFRPGTDLEVVVADDGATRPDSLRALEAASRLPWVRVVRTAGRVGPSGARNLAAAAARGEWLAFLDADDRFAPDALQQRMALAQSDPAVSCVATDYAEFPADSPFSPAGLAGVIAGTPHRRVPVQAAYDTARPVVLRQSLPALIGAVPFWTGAITLRRDRFQALGGFPEAHRIGEDLHLWLRIAATECIAFSPRITAYCRKGHASLTRREARLNLQTARCYEHLLSDPLMNAVQAQIADLVASSYRAASYEARTEGRPLEAMRLALCALRRSPWQPASWRSLSLSWIKPHTADA